MNIRVFLTALFALLLLSGPATAAPIESLDTFHVKTGKVGMRADSLELRSASSVYLYLLKGAGSLAANRTFTIPDSGANASFVMSEGAQTINGVKTFGSAPVITGGLTAANIQTGSAKREIFIAKMCPAGGAAASNSTVYFANVYFGRAGTVKRITYGTNIDPVSGTNTVKVLKNGAAGNTMLSTASVSLNGATANVGQNATLTATGADLVFTATGSAYCEYSAGTQGAAAKDVTAVIEFEPDDF